MTENLGYSPQPVEFTDVVLEGEHVTSKKKKEPRRLVHFSDGVLEEYSTDEEEDQPAPPPPINPKTLSWVPWMWHYASTAAVKTLGAADTCGEKLAWFFGITSPKYQSAIDEFYRLKAEEEKEEEEVQSYKKNMALLYNVIVEGPTGEKTVGDPNNQKF
ncbi:protein FAM177A1-like isoform X2 [Dreissena polymorpha]|uniref:protein FAM177A1-like isoform X2 n=1 Tax=Dreissena polymorpha TaxID=45954 RepID=UPI002264B239|nr:protein FAM177A1-like isoform X2 [Dreissena polymorpha]